MKYEPYGLSPEGIDALRKKGHTLELIVMGDEVGTAAYIGDVEAVMIDPQSGLRLGASDPRNPDARAVGY